MNAPHIPGLGPVWRDELNRAHRELQVRVINTAPGTAPQLQQAAEIASAAAVEPTHSTNGNAPR